MRPKVSAEVAPALKAVTEAFRAQGVEVALAHASAAQCYGVNEWSDGKPGKPDSAHLFFETDASNEDAVSLVLAEFATGGAEGDAATGIWANFQSPLGGQASSTVGISVEFQTIGASIRDVAHAVVMGGTTTFVLKPEILRDRYLEFGTKIQQDKTALDDQLAERLTERAEQLAADPKAGKAALAEIDRILQHRVLSENPDDHIDSDALDYLTTAGELQMMMTIDAHARALLN